MTPILLRKGKVKVALYGIGHLKDLRLNLAFERGAIKFERPLNKEDGSIDESYFNIFVLHQNRYKGMHSFDTRNSITEETIPDWVDFCLWGHEHECHPGLHTVHST